MRKPPTLDPNCKACKRPFQPGEQTMPVWEWGGQCIGAIHCDLTCVFWKKDPAPMTQWDIRHNYVDGRYVVQNRTVNESDTERYYFLTLWGAKRKVRKLKRKETR